MPPRSRSPLVIVAVVALLTLAATAAVWDQAREAEESQRRAILQHRLDELKSQIQQRLSALHGLLAGAQGLFAASKSVERAEWHEFVERMDLPARWPEVYNFAWVCWVPREQRKAFLAATRADGAPDFQIHPTGETEASLVITYAEPACRNALVVGYDLLTRPPSADAITRARDAGQVAMSQGVRLIQEPARQMAVSITLPVYRNGSRHDTLEERRASFQGCVQIAVRLGDLMCAVLVRREPTWAIRLIDGNAVARADDLYAQEGASGGPMLPGTATIDIAGRRWVLDVAIPTRSLDEETPRLAAMVLFAGLGASTLLTLLVWSLATRHGRALTLASAMTRDLQLNNERIRGILDSANDGIFTMSEDGIVESMNGAAGRLFGYSPAEVIGRSMTMLMPERWRELHTRGLEILRKRGESKVLGRTIEVEGLRRDGSTMVVELAVSELRLGDRRIFTGIVRDVTERRSHERELQVANRKLADAMAKLERTQKDVVQQERLRAIGTMASGIAHDFNNSLAAILGFTELLLANEAVRRDAESLSRHLRLIRTAAQDASGVVGRLREFYRHRDEAEELTSVDLNKLVEDAISLTRPSWKHIAQTRGIDISVRSQLATGLPHVRANPTEVREVLINLINNAVEAMTQGGWLTATSRADGTNVVVEIEDTGAGMNDEVLRRCMEPFFTTKGSHGSGLGLSMAFGVMKRHGGLLKVESAPGEGTRVRLTFPGAGRVPPPVGEPSAPVATAGLNVLVVEDDPLVQQVVAGYLAAAGHTVETASDGQEGLQKFLAGRFDLLVTDQGMPSLTGTQLAAAVKRAAPNKPIIMLTGWGDQMKAAGERPAGVDRILNKPVTLQELMSAVGEVVSRPR